MTRPTQRLCLALPFIALAALLPRVADAQEKSLSPGINKPYEGIKIDDALKRFEGESREIFRKRNEIAAACGVKPGMCVADVGAGTGLFTRLFSPLVGPQGKVMAVDITPQFVEYVEETCKKDGLRNVTGVLCKADSVELDTASVDLAFVCDTYHHFEFPQKMLGSIHRALKPGGRLVIVDFKVGEGKEGEFARKHVRAAQPQVVREAAAAGFQLLDEPLAMDTQWMARFTKDYFLLRGSLANSRVRFEKDKTGRVAFLGGSITAMDPGWRSMTCEALRRRFPETEFDFINAGIPSTDSTLGAFRLGETVFHRGPVDLLFVEFAVNDHHNARVAEERVRGMEGIVRQARARNPAIDVVLLYSAEPSKTLAYRSWRVPPEIASHELVASHYSVPAIDFALEVTQRVTAGEFSWDKDFGDLHPSPFGHKLYAATIGRMLDTAWKGPLKADAKVQAHAMPQDPLEPFNYEHGRYVDLAAAKLEKGWKLDPCWKAAEGATRPGFHEVPMLTADQPGATLKLAFEGTAVGVLVAAGPDAGVLEYQIDGGPAREMDQFTFWSPTLHIPWAYVLAADLKPGKHELVLRLSDKKNPKSKGHAARIVRFLAGG